MLRFLCKRLKDPVFSSKIVAYFFLQIHSKYALKSSIHVGYTSSRDHNPSGWALGLENTGSILCQVIYVFQFFFKNQLVFMYEHNTFFKTNKGLKKVH